MSNTNKVPCGGFELDNTLKLSNNKLTTVAGGGVSEYDKVLGNTYEDYQKAMIDGNIYGVDVEGIEYHDIMYYGSGSFSSIYRFDKYELTINHRYITTSLKDLTTDTIVDLYGFIAPVTEYSKIPSEFLSNGNIVNSGSNSIKASEGLGELNIDLGTDNSFYAEQHSGVIIGYRNTNIESFAAGYLNTGINAIGHDNTSPVFNSGSIALGAYNINGVNSRNCVLAGHNLRGVQGQSAVYVGQYSNTSIKEPKKQLCFVVGNGTASVSSEMNNAIEVYTDNIYVNSPMICDKIILKSPDNTLFYLTVSNDGTLSATKVDS